MFPEIKRHEKADPVAQRQFIHTILSPHSFWLGSHPPTLHTRYLQ
jgi:hypothetical protein